MNSIQTGRYSIRMHNEIKDLFGDKGIIQTLKGRKRASWGGIYGDITKGHAEMKIRKQEINKRGKKKKRINGLRSTEVGDR